jgi:hypothetical protein
MEILRRLCLVILVPLFSLLLFVTAFDIGFVHTATQPKVVKKIVADSGVYNSIVANALAQTKSISTSLGTIDTSSPLIQKAANQAVTPLDVQRQAEPAIDNIYQWLDGDIARPSFKIDLAGQRNDFANRGADAIRQQLAALPACKTLQQLRSFNPLSATCIPPGVSLNTIRDQVQKSLVSSNFLSDSEISAANLTTTNGQGAEQSIFDTASAQQVAKKYQSLKKTPWFLILLTLICATGILLLSGTRRRGLRHIGISLLTVGVLMLLLAFLLPKAISTDVAPKVRLNSADIKIDAPKAVNDITQRIDKNYWFFGVLYSLLGIAAITCGHYATRNKPNKKLPAR